MAVVLSLNAKVYRNTNTYASPTWNLIDGIQNLTLSMEKSEANVSTRAASWEQVAATLKKASLEFNMPWDKSDADQQALLDDFVLADGAGIELLIIEGAVDTVGVEGLRASFDVTKFNIPQDLEGAMMVEVAMKPTKNSDAAPAWYTDDGP